MRVTALRAAILSLFLLPLVCLQAACTEKKLPAAEDVLDLSQSPDMTDGGVIKDDGGPLPPSCPGVPLVTSGALDVDLKSLQVSGTVTLNGQPMPDATRERGRILFTATKTGASVSASLKSSGPATYALVLAPGTYSVRFVGNGALCGSASNTIPCIDGVLQQELTLTSSGAVPLDLKSVTISGRVTLDGGELPSGADGSGSLVFKNAAGEADTSVNSAPLSGYRMVLLPGTYTVEWKPRFGRCEAGQGLPCIGGPLRKDLNVQSSGAVSFDLQTTRVSGQVTVAGSPVSGPEQGLGEVSFALQGGGTVTTAASASGKGLAAYSLTLLKGTYDLSFAPAGGNDCTKQVPCVSGPLQQGVPLTSSGTVNVDVPAISVRGAVTFGGKSAGEFENGTLVFTLASGGSVTTRGTGPRRLGSYALRVLPGRYAVSFRGGPGCNTGPAVTPCNGGVLTTGIVLTTDGTADFDVPVVSISGQITVNGAMPAASPGQVSFSLRSPDGSSDPGSVGSVGLGSYAVRLLKGSYDIDYLPSLGACPAAGDVPCVGGRLQSAVMLSSAGTVNLDIPMITVSGQVTLNGRPLPDSSGERGQLRFGASGGEGGSEFFGSTGAGSYKVRLIPGSYVVKHRAQPDRCADGFSMGLIPCIDQYVAGCR